MANVLSEDAKLYYNTATYGSPNWVEITDVKDLTLNLDKGEADATTRGSGGFSEFLDGLIDASIEFSLLWDNGSSVFTAIRTAFFNKTALEFLCLDGPTGTEGSEGLRATCMVKSFTRNENLGEALMADITIRPRKNSDAAPAWYVEPAPGA